MATKARLLAFLAIPLFAGASVAQELKQGELVLSASIDVRVESTPEAQLAYASSLLRDVATASDSERPIAVGRVLAHLAAIEHYWPGATNAVFESLLLQADVALSNRMPTAALDALEKARKRRDGPELGYRAAKALLMLGNADEATVRIDQSTNHPAFNGMSFIERQKALQVGVTLAERLSDTNRMLRYLRAAAGIEELGPGVRAGYRLAAIRHALSKGSRQEAQKDLAELNKLLADSKLRELSGEERRTLDDAEAQAKKHAASFGG
ncbi:MAG TPA: hypothetical protein VGF40_14905 [Thermoanaerobaculia bacterium]